MKRLLFIGCLIWTLSACQAGIGSKTTVLPKSSYSVNQLSDYGQSSPVLDVVVKNPYSEAICIPRSTFDSTVATIGMRHGAYEIPRRQVSDVFPPEFSTQLYADAYYIVVPGKGWRDIVRLDNFDLKTTETYSAFVRWVFYYCSDLIGSGVSQGAEPKRLIKLNVDNIRVAAPW